RPSAPRWITSASGPSGESCCDIGSSFPCWPQSFWLRHAGGYEADGERSADVAMHGPEARACEADTGPHSSPWSATTVRVAIKAMRTTTRSTTAAHVDSSHMPSSPYPRGSRRPSSPALCGSFIRYDPAEPDRAREMVVRVITNEASRAGGVRSEEHTSELQSR